MRANFAINSTALPDRYRLAPDYFVKLAAFDEFHAEVAGAIALADFVNGNDAWMVEAGGSFCFATKTLQMRFGGPGAQADYFECDGAIETFLTRAINYALTTPADFLQQFIVAEVSETFLCRSLLLAALRRDQHIVILVVEQTKTGL